MRKRGLFISLLLLLGFAFGVGLLPKKTNHYYQLSRPLSQWLPDALNDWTYVDQPIADTPEVKEAVAELLNFSDGIYRVYRSRAGKEIKVYVAYWIPGKMDPRLVGVHSPDVCWVGAGWTQVGAKRRRTLSAADGLTLRNGHERTFEISGHREDVVFWHFVGGKPSRYLEPDLSAWTFKEIFRNPLSPRYEQFFVRISTAGSLDEVADDPMMQRIVETLSAVQDATPQKGEG